MGQTQKRASRAKLTVKYNDLAVAKRAKSTVQTQTEWAVEGVRGLSLVVKPPRPGAGKLSGVATFYVRYQIGSGANREQRRQAIGRAGEGGMTLATARDKAEELTGKVESGIDPVAEQKAIGAEMTLRQLFAERLAKDKKTAPRTLEDYQGILEKDVLETLGDKPANRIKPEEFALVLEGIEARAKHAAHKARSALGSTYRYGQTQWRKGARLVVVNPIVGIGFNHQSNRRKVRLTDADLGKLWNAANRPDAADEGTRLIVQLAILTGQRNSEVAGAELDELKGLGAATPRWDIPARRMKRKSDDQFVPLAPQAVTRFKRAIEIANGSKYIFPGTTHGRRGDEWRQDHIGQETVSKAMARIVKLAGLKDLRLHDMRKVLTTWLAEHGHATPEVLDAILHHGRKGVTGTHYNFALYEGQVRKALQLWANHVEAVATGGKDEGNVHQLVPATA
jgi:integrase